MRDVDCFGCLMGIIAIGIVATLFLGAIILLVLGAPAP